MAEGVRNRWLKYYSTLSCKWSDWFELLSDHWITLFFMFIMSSLISLYLHRRFQWWLRVFVEIFVFSSFQNASSNHTTADSINYRERSCGWRSLNEYERPASIADIAWLSRSRSEMASRERSMMVSYASLFRVFQIFIPSLQKKYNIIILHDRTMTHSEFIKFEFIVEVDFIY